MSTLKLASMSLGAALLLGIWTPAQAQITVDGVEDKTVYADRVSFRVPSAAGYDTTALLDGTPQPMDVFVDVTDVAYHELLVKRQPKPAGAEESLLVRFIVRSSERGDSEWGLPPWTPYPMIPSASAEFEGAQLEIVAPREFPLGLEIPLAARVKDGSGKRVGVNGAITAGGFPGHSLQLFRGVGSAFLPAASAPGTLSYDASIQTLGATKEIAVEAATTWTSVSGTIGSSTTWAEGSRIRVTGDVTVAAGVTLTVRPGTVVRLAAGADLTVAGTVLVQGNLERPVVFTPDSRTSPWGGFILRTSSSRIDMTGAILTGSGADPSWFDNNTWAGGSHRHEQCLFYLSDGAAAALTDCFLFDHSGQAGHGADGSLTMTRCLVQKFTTAGQYSGGAFTLTDCALIEFPYDGAPFVDGDNDALYLSSGARTLTNCLIGWTGDDGIDAGGGGTGPINVTGCWFESTVHEAMALSEPGARTIKSTVALNCGQGVEAGYNDPKADAQDCFLTANLVGARMGDNYDWDYNATFLKVTSSLLLYNLRNIWGKTWDTWEERLSQMDLQGNYLSAPDPLHPNNATWDPAVDAPRLEPFHPTRPGPVGIGLALRSSRPSAPAIAKGIPVRLSTFTTIPVSVDYRVESESVLLAGGTLDFAPGESLKLIEADGLDQHGLIRVILSNPQGGELTGLTEASVVHPVTLVSLGSSWKYLDTGADQGTAWRNPQFNDAAWKSGNAELGFGEGDEATVVNGGPSDARYSTIYFRRSFDVQDPAAFESLSLRIRYDDGAVVYLNGAEVHRVNLPGGAIGYATLAPDAAENDTDTAQLDAGALVAGKNVLAVEVHQTTATSSDLSFDLELTAVPSEGPPPSGFIRGDANGDGVLDVSDPVKILFVLFLGAATDCSDALDADDTGEANLTDAIHLLNYLFLSGPPIPEPFPARGADPTPDAIDCARA